MGNKFKFEDDAWEELEEFYGDELDIHDADYAKAVEEELDNSMKDVLYLGEGDPGEFVENIELDLTDDKGMIFHVELVGRLDMEDDQHYLMLHSLDDSDPTRIWLVKAWDDAEGNLQVSDIEDPEEYARVLEFAEQTLYDNPEAEDIEGGGVQWDD